MDVDVITRAGIVFWVAYLGNGIACLFQGRGISCLIHLLCSTRCIPRFMRSMTVDCLCWGSEFACCVIRTILQTQRNPRNKNNVGRFRHPQIHRNMGPPHQITRPRTLPLTAKTFKQLLLTLRGEEFGSRLRIMVRQGRSPDPRRLLLCKLLPQILPHIPAE